MSDVNLSVRVKWILDSMAAAFGGASQYSMQHLGAALIGQRNNNGLQGDYAEIAASAAALLAEQWSWTAETEYKHAAEILQAMNDDHERRIQATMLEARKDLRRPVGCDEVDREMETCRKIVRLLGMLIGDMRLHPRIAGMALASAIQDGDVTNNAEAAADWASGALWSDRFDSAFTDERDVLAWIGEATAACEVAL